MTRQFEATLTSKGQITVPAKMRENLRLGPGDKIVFTEGRDGTFSVAARTQRVGDLKGFVGKGPAVTSADIAGFIDQARGRSVVETE